MPVASGGPRPHPNANYAGLPSYPPPPAKNSSIWPPGGFVPGDPLYIVDREHRVTRILSGNLYTCVLTLIRANASIRDLIRQHESAWMALRLLYNHVVILQNLLQRLREMFVNLPHVETVARDVNVFEGVPKDTKDVKEARESKDGKGKKKHSSSSSHTGNSLTSVAIPTNQSALAWSNRVLPKMEHMMEELRPFLNDVESACRSAVLRRQSRLLQDPDAMPLRWNDNYIYSTARKLNGFEHQLEVHMTTCKYIHMISTDSLYQNKHGMSIQDSGMAHYYLDDGSSSHDRPAFYSFWSSMSLAKAAKRRRDKERKQLKEKQDAELGLSPKRSDSKKTSKSSSSSSSSSSRTPKKSKGKTKEDHTPTPPQAPASKEDLLAAIDRKDYLTVVTLLMSDMSLNDMLEDGTFVLSHAVDDDNSALVSILAMCGADPNVKHSSGNTPLHFASNTNCVAPAVLLLEIGAKVDVRDAQGLTPLHVACRERNFSVVLQLLAHGADPNVCDNRGLTPLSYVLMHPKRPSLSRECLVALLTYGARLTGRGLVLPPFIEAIFRNDSNTMCRHLQAHLEDAEAPMSVATTGPDGGIVQIRPMYAAILVGNIYAIDQLLRRHVDVHHLTTAYGKTTTYLSLAVQGDSTPIVARLLLANADPNIANARGRTPLHLAAATPHGEVEVVELLLRHGADVQAQTHDRHSQALHMAVRVGRADTCFHLLKKGAEVDRPLRSGVTPIMLAVYYNNKTMLRFLMSNGGDVRYKTPLYGETAMHTAARIGNVGLAILLQQHGLSVNAVNPFEAELEPEAATTSEPPQAEIDDDDEDTVEEGPSKSSKKDKAKKKGKGKGKNKDKDTVVSPATRRSRSGFAPIHAAASRGHMDMVRWLLANGADPTARIGRFASRVCLGKDKAKYKGRGRDGKSVSYAKYDVNDDAEEAAPTSDKVEQDQDDDDPGETPVEVARAFGHERTAGLIEDAIIAAMPAVKEYSSQSSSQSASSSSSSQPSVSSSTSPSTTSPSTSFSADPLARKSSPPLAKPPPQYSLDPDPVFDSADEGDQLAGELRKGKGKKKAETAEEEGGVEDNNADEDAANLTE